MWLVIDQVPQTSVVTSLKSYTEEVFKYNRRGKTRATSVLVLQSWTLQTLGHLMLLCISHHIWCTMN